MEYEHVVHSFEPVYNTDSKILILGTLPSVKSRENHFYYGHKQNRFWKLLARICEEDVPETIEEKKAMLLRNHIAIWDVIYSCDIQGSSDSSIKNVVPTDLKAIVKDSNVKRIFCNGKTSGTYFQKYQQKELGIEAEVLPSTSPANAAYSVERLVGIWKEKIGKM